MERRRSEESAVDYEEVRRGWFLGSEEFRQELLAAAGERVGPSHCGSERHESGVQKADRIVKGETERLGWHVNELRTRRKGDTDKIAVARRLQQETTMSLKWIA